MMHIHLLRGAWGPLLAALALAPASPARADDSKGIAFFETKIRPVLIAQCYECHSAKAAKVRGGLLLDTRDGIRAGGDTGPAVVPGDTGKSLLIKAIKHDGLEMPPKKTLPASVVADFTQWVQIGAPDPRTAVNTAYRRMTAEEAQNFWSLKPVEKPQPPKVRRSDWPRNDIDRFILAKIEQKDLSPVADADRRVLIRRLAFDLIGLPPTPDEVAAFVNDKSDNAVEALVDRLLASPRFGERWGRYWLDLARYAESNGNADNTPFPHAWRYRDYVIASFNKDKPYDRFITEQVAGDLLQTDDSKAEKDELLTATGFLALTSKPRAQNNPDYRMDLVADQIDVTTRAVLGLTVMCARCHDHKFDPISTKEYYALAGIFDSTVMLAGANGRGNPKKKKAAPVGGLHKLSDGGEAMGVREGSARECNVCIRGESRNTGERVRRGFLSIATHGAPPSIPSSSSGRLQLAEWLTTRYNPLTARVAVNRVWQQLFGRGLVNSPDNFGSLGERPSHPELLDWLAARFMEDGWSMKKAIRQVVLSRTYQLGSDHHAANHKGDPDNILHWRMSPRRLDAEQIRDAMLAVSGKLDVTPPKGSAAGATPQGNRTRYAPVEKNCRSVYLGVPRGAALPELLSVFDLANPNLVVAQREVTTVPAQALYLMNNAFVTDSAKGLAKRLLDASGDDAARVELGYQLALGRPATEKERERVVKFLGEKPNPAAWAGFCQALLASAEFRYLD